MATGPIHQWARVGAARAERAGGRSVARSGAGSAPGGAERSRGLIKIDGARRIPADAVRDFILGQIEEAA
ncbi:hypothetical protein [Streptomyces sp. NRRL S-813]|uniref:hypothetical protein n=1 Tax=Streptomyces sp. NRRL S-813 TaxID=1463919 RepID=UPI0004C175F1|nr:hypothetical protein [Streptomyces sp. NRRL S-813]